MSTIKSNRINQRGKGAPSSTMTLEEAFGSVPALDPPKDWKQIEKEVREERAQQYFEKFLK